MESSLMNKISWKCVIVLLASLLTLQNLVAATPESTDSSLQALQQLQRLTQSTREQVASQTQPQTPVPPPSGEPLPKQQNALPAGTPGSTQTSPPVQQGQQAIAGPPQPTAQQPPTTLSATSGGSHETRMQSVVSAEAEEAIEEAAFKAALKDTFPLSPEQILRLRQAYNTTRLAESSEPGTPPKPVASSQIVNLAPGSTPPVIRLAQGFVSSLVFLDSTGAPWPIAAYDLGDPQTFNIQWNRTDNTLMIQAMKLYKYGNLAVRLHNLNTPVMLTLIPGQKAVDYRVDLRIQGIGPNAKPAPTGQGLPPGANPLLLKILDGVAPPGARVVNVTGGEAQAWVQSDKLFLRTRLTILSPGWIATMESADGMRAYEMTKTPMLLVSQEGKIMQLKIEGL